MSQASRFLFKSLRFDEGYQPSETTRITTNFANLARGAGRRDNLRNTLNMINNRLNSLAYWDNPGRDRYAIDIDIISIEGSIDAEGGRDTFPLIEWLNTHITDRTTGTRTQGITGNNFSSYIRDYDFSVLLPEHNRDQPAFSLPDDFGSLHGQLFRNLIQSSDYRDQFGKPPVICISISSSRTYLRTGNHHPVLGVEYRQDEPSSTDRYFEKMGLQVRHFMPPAAAAPLAFYHVGDLLNDYTNLELISTISTMETFQKIYRPEIYNANSAAGKLYQPSLKNQDYSLTQIVYDREERSQLAVKQGKFTEEHFIKPYAKTLESWAANYAL